MSVSHCGSKRFWHVLFDMPMKTRSKSVAAICAHESHVAALARMRQRHPRSVAEDSISKRMRTEGIENTHSVHYTTAVAAKGQRSDAREKDDHAYEETANIKKEPRRP